MNMSLVQDLNELTGDPMESEDALSHWQNVNETEKQYEISSSRSTSAHKRLLFAILRVYYRANNIDY